MPNPMNVYSVDWEDAKGDHTSWFATLDEACNFSGECNAVPDPLPVAQDPIIHQIYFDKKGVVRFLNYLELCK